MSARLQLEKRAMLLQRLAYKVLTSPKLRLASLERFVGDSSLDKDMSTVLSVLFAGDSLVGEGTSVTSTPIHFLDQLRNGLESRGIRLPSFRRRFDWVKDTSGGTFTNNEADPTARDDIRALDKPLRRIQEKLYELRLHDAEHIRDNRGRVTTTHRGAELVALMESLISSVKKMSVSKVPEAPIGIRTDTQKAEFLNKRYDEVAALLNSSTGTTAAGPTLSLLHVTKTKNWYAVAESDVPQLEAAVVGVRPDWKLDDNTKYEYPSNLLDEPEPAQISVTFDPENTQVNNNTRAFWSRELKRLELVSGGGIKTSLEDNVATLTSTNTHAIAQQAELLEHTFGATAGLLRGGAGAERRNAELEALEGVSQPGSEGTDVVRLVQLPFTPDQIDDAFPSVEIRDERFIGKNLSRVTLELISKARFSGFVEFDDKYRMIILWANAPGDDQTDENGATFSDHLRTILSSRKSKFAAILGQSPEVMKTKTGAALYFPRPASLPHVIKNRGELEEAIADVNSLVDKMEQRSSLSRTFNRSISDDELPMPLEETG